MANSTLYINNVSAYPISISARFERNRQLQRTIAAGSSLDVSGVCTLDELNRDANISHLFAAGKITITSTPGASDLPGTSLTVADVARMTISADSTLQASVIGATTEAIHTALTITPAMMSQARRLIRFYARLHVIAANSTDTWTFRARLDGLTGTLIQASTAIDITTNDIYTFSGAIELRTLGASGTFDSVCTFTDVINGTATANASVRGGAVDTTASKTLVITGRCSTNNAGNQVSLRHFSASVYPA